MAKKSRCKKGTVHVYCHYEKQVIPCSECYPCAECDPCAYCDEVECPYSPRITAANGAEKANAPVFELGA